MHTDAPNPCTDSNQQRKCNVACCRYEALVAIIGRVPVQMWARVRPVSVQMWARRAHLSAWLRRSLIDTVTIATIPATKAARSRHAVAMRAPLLVFAACRRHCSRDGAQPGFTERKEARDGDRERRRQSPAHQP